MVCRILILVVVGCSWDGVNRDGVAIPGRTQRPQNPARTSRKPTLRFLDRTNRTTGRPFCVNYRAAYSLTPRRPPPGGSVDSYRCHYHCHCYSLYLYLLLLTRIWNAYVYMPVFFFVLVLLYHPGFHRPVLYRWSHRFRLRSRPKLSLIHI